MKVDRNQMIGDKADLAAVDGTATFYRFSGHHGIPLRLEIAARILSGWCANTDPEVNPRASSALDLADALIEAHNETCEARAK